MPKREHTFRQSWLNSFFGKCPEQARLERAGDLPRRESDSTIMGTAVHYAIETSVDELVHTGAPLDRDDLYDRFTWAFNRELTEAAEQGNPIDWIKRNEQQARTTGHSLLLKWDTYMPSRLDPIATEVEFGPLLFHESDEWRAYLTGTIDYLDTHPWDWKTASSKGSWKKWEKDRWAIQPTVYTWAYNQWRAYRDLPMLDTIPFTYCVLAEDAAEPILITIERGVDHWNWLRQQLEGVVGLIEADLPHWPLNDHGWWCSARWCPAFNECKGAQMGEDLWK